MLFVLCMIAWVYGSLRAPSGHLPENWLGRHVTVQGTVMSTFLSAHGASVYVQTAIMSQGTEQLSCAVVIRWSSRLTNLHPGDEVSLEGNILPTNHSPSSTSHPTSHGSTVQYELSGRAIKVKHTQSVLADGLQKNSLDFIQSSGEMTQVEASLAYSIVFGGPQMDAATKQKFLSAGLLHVLAASGANLMILESFAAWMTRAAWRRIGLPRMLWYIQMFTLIWCFAAVCRFDVSVVRAACMTSYRLIGEWAGRSTTLFAGLIASALVLSALNPDFMVSISSVLSFAATTAVAFALYGGSQVPTAASSSRMHRLRSALKQYVSRLIKSTVLVEMGLAPITVLSFHQWTPYSLVSNLLADPLLAALLPVTALWIAFLWVHVVIPIPYVCLDWLGAITRFLLMGLDKWVNWISQQPMALLTLPTLPGWLIIPYFVLLWQGYRFLHKVRHLSRGRTNLV